MTEWTVDEVADWCLTIIPNNDELRQVFYYYYLIHSLSQVFKIQTSVITTLFVAKIINDWFPRDNIKTSQIDGSKLQTLNEQNLSETLGITKFVLKRKLSLAIKKASTQLGMQRGSSNLDNSPASGDESTTSKSREIIATSTPDKKGEPMTSPLASPAISPIKADTPNTSLDSTHYSVPEQPNKKRKHDDSESSLDVTPPASKRLKSRLVPLYQIHHARKY